MNTELERPVVRLRELEDKSAVGYESLRAQHEQLIRENELLKAKMEVARMRLDVFLNNRILDGSLLKQALASIVKGLHE